MKRIASFLRFVRIKNLRMCLCMIDAVSFTSACLSTMTGIDDSLRHAVDLVEKNAGKKKYEQMDIFFQFSI